MEFISPKATENYILTADRKKKKEKRTVFLLSFLSAEERALVMDIMTKPDKFMASLSVMDIGLSKIENGFCDGEELVLVRNERKAYLGETKKRPWKRDVFDRMDLNSVDEIAGRIIESCAITEKERKN